MYDFTPLLVAVTALVVAVTALIRLYLLSKGMEEMKDAPSPKKTVFQSSRPTPTRNGSVNIPARTNERQFALSEGIESEIAHFIRTVLKHGDLVCFTVTSDGGALSVTVVQGQTRYKGYAPTDDAAVSLFSDLISDLYA